MLGRRRRVSRVKKKQPEDDDGTQQQDEQIADEQDHEKVEISKPESQPAVVEVKKSQAPVALVQQKSSKKPRVEEVESNKEESKEWGSRQPKPVDSDILKYALTTGGELARRSNDLKQLEGRKDEEGDEELEKRISDDTNAVVHLRAALFKEIKEGEASIACDKRGSRVLQNLVKDGPTDVILGVFERLKPYIGHLIYDPFASHVLQALLERCSTENASSEKEKMYVSQMCAQISKANEWWAMMHDISATHVARSSAMAMARIKDEQGLDALFKSLKGASQADFRSAARNPQAGPFLASAINSMPNEEKRELLLLRLFSDERNQVTLERKQFDSCVQDRIGSRVVDQCVQHCSRKFVEDVVLNQGFASPFLARSAKHQFANFVVQRVLEASRDVSSLARAASECAVKDMLDFDRVGVLAAIAKALGQVPEGTSGRDELQLKYCTELVSNKVLSRAMQHMRAMTGEETGGEKHAGNEDGEPEAKKRPAIKESVPVQVHLALTETIHQVLLLFPKETKQPLLDELLVKMEANQLVRLACDPVGGKKIIECVLDSTSDKVVARTMAEKFISHYSRLLLDPFGVHVARKSFQLLKINDKVQVMEKEIVPNKNKFAGSTQANKFVSSVAVTQFAANKTEWLKKFDEKKAKEKSSKKVSVKEQWENELGL